MLIETALALVMLTQPAPEAAESADVAYQQLVEGRDQEAIEQLEASMKAGTELANDDPARLLNLGIAHARQGNADRARELFRAAMVSDERAELETASGEWEDSATLARKALRMLSKGDLAPARVSLR